MDYRSPMYLKPAIAMILLLLPAHRSPLATPAHVIKVSSVGMPEAKAVCISFKRYTRFAVGILETHPTKRDLEVRKFFTQAGFKIMVQKDVKSWLWNHFALNAAMEAEVLKHGSFKKVISSREALNGVAQNLNEIVPVLKARGSKLDLLTIVLSSLPPKIVDFLMSHVVFSPKSMAYALMVHNHFKVGYAVQEVIRSARKYGIKTPRL